MENSLKQQMKTLLKEMRKAQLFAMSGDPATTEVVWYDGEDHEVRLDVETGIVQAGGGRGFYWEVGNLYTGQKAVSRRIPVEHYQRPGETDDTVAP